MTLRNFILVLALGALTTPAAAQPGGKVIHLVVPFAVGRQRIGTVDVSLAVPVTESPTRFLDDGDDGGDVPGVDAVLDHDLAGPLGDEHEAQPARQGGERPDEGGGGKADADRVGDQTARNEEDDGRGAEAHEEAAAAFRE